MVKAELLLALTVLPAVFISAPPPATWPWLGLAPGGLASRRSGRTHGAWGNGVRRRRLNLSQGAGVIA